MASLRDKLPSINLLVTFDAAARHLSFKHAAEELFVTPSAVGHQIRVLEQEIQTVLFVRMNRSVELTAEGRDYHQKISQGLQILKNATRDLMTRNSKSSLLIHSIPFITKKILVPKIKDFKASHPGTNIRIESKTRRADLGSSDLQIAIRQGKAEDKDVIYREITPIHVSPICVPGYLNQSSLSLIRLSSDKHSWALWQNEWNTHLQFDEVIDCDDLQSVIDMALQGLGLAMGFFPSLNVYLEQHQLECPFPDKMTRLESLYLAYSKTHAEHPLIHDFVDWFSELISHS
jgi:LysR family glycine cleavage system transcriptional activator